MADGIFATLVSKDRNANEVANPIYTQLSDGAAVVGVTGGALDVNVTNTSIAVTGTVDIGNTVTVSGTVDIGNTVTVSGTVDIGNTVAVTASDLDIRQLTHLGGSTAFDSVRIGDGTTVLDVNTDGSINVNIVNAAVSGEVHDYDLGASVGADLTSDHDYTVAGTFLVKSIICSASGNAKFEVKVGPVASLATVAVVFLNGRQGDTQQIVFDPPIEVASTSTGTVRVTRTNRQGAAMDVYSTIVGREI